MLCDFCHVKMKWPKLINGYTSQNDVYISGDNTWSSPEAVFRKAANILFLNLVVVTQMCLLFNTYQAILF